MVDQIGLFDERFFFFSEEIDLCPRAHLAGWQVLHVPSAEVVHVGGGSTGSSARRITYCFIVANCCILKSITVHLRAKNYFLPWRSQVGLNRKCMAFRKKHRRCPERSRSGKLFQAGLRNKIFSPTSMHILFLSQLLPYPPDTGAKVRSYYILRYLAQSTPHNSAGFHPPR